MRWMRSRMKRLSSIYKGMKRIAGDGKLINQTGMHSIAR